jgi:hypothetical protein
MFPYMDQAVQFDQHSGAVKMHQPTTLNAAL